MLVRRAGREQQQRQHPTAQCFWQDPCKGASPWPAPHALGAARFLHCISRLATHFRSLQWVDAPLGLCTQVIEYCRYHVEAGPQEGSEKPGKSEEEVKTWDNEFVKVDQGTLFELILVRLLCSAMRHQRKLAQRDVSLHHAWHVHRAVRLQV